LQDPPKITQIWIFGLKLNHLATDMIGGTWHTKICGKTFLQTDPPPVFVTVIRPSFGLKNGGYVVARSNPTKSYK
jgi:hypothetical protein